jgi:hypothetical protein
MHFYNVGYTESGLCVGGEGVSWILDGSCMDWKEDAGLKMHLFIHLIPHLVGSLFWRALFFTFLLVCRSFVSVFITLLGTGWANIALGESIGSGFGEGGNMITCWYHFFSVSFHVCCWGCLRWIQHFNILLE